MMRKPLILALMGATLLSSCGVPHVEPQLKPVAADSVGLGTDAAPRFATDWWTALGDPQLDRIMTDALAGSPTLAAAMARVRQADAMLAAAGAARQPQISADAQEQRIRLSDTYTIPPPYGGTTQWVGQAQANLSWNLDLFGRQAAAIEQARASTRAATLDADAAQLALSGSIAQTYVELARAEQQIAIGERFVQSRDNGLRLARVRIRNDLASRFDETAADTLLAEARQSLEQAKGQRALAAHALAMLAGRGADYAAAITPSTMRFDTVLPLPDTLPADLLSRRPDILAAQARIEAAAAGRQVARRAFYPDINLSALVGPQAVGLGNLFTGGAVSVGAGAALHLPIFEGGRLTAGLKQATAGVDSAIADYDRTVLGAVREASDALSQIGADQAQLVQQRKALAGQREVVRLNAVRVSTGLSSQLDKLASDDRVLQAEQAATNIEADAADRRIALLIALGGGFDAGNQTNDRNNP